MNKITEIEKAVDELSESEYREFRQRFLEKDWEMWDEQIEADSKTGKLDFLIQEALDAKARDELRNL
ncbi:MAG: hypothetical protein GC154_11750 [bacterium]|nr:hypothetical protein [bacterium]